MKLCFNYLWSVVELYNNIPKGYTFILYYERVNENTCEHASYVVSGEHSTENERESKRQAK